jgi:phospholipase C
MSPLDNIKNIVIVMMENRSFDHMLGHLSLPPFNRRDVDGLSNDSEWIKRYTNYDGGNAYPPRRSTNPYWLPDKFDPPHERINIAEQLGKPVNDEYPMNGFVSALPQTLSTQPEDRRLVMDYFGAEEVPISHFFAEKFAICDRWFCSLPAGTQANRLIAMGGASKIDTNRTPLPNHPLVFDWLTAHKVSWRVYHEGLPFFALIPTRLKEILDRDHYRPFAQFADDIDSTPPNKLPQVMFIEPTYGDSPRIGCSTDDHAPSGVADGQEFLMQVYNAVTRSEKFWETSLMVVTYDEHGGFFDHVSPPTVKTNAPTGNSYREFESLGVRVPAYVISPWVREKSVHKGCLDHTSILKLLGQKFGGGKYSDVVDARKVGNVSDVLDLKNPVMKCPAAPEVSKYLAKRPPKVAGVTRPPTDSPIREGFADALQRMRDEGVDETHPVYGELIRQ